MRTTASVASSILAPVMVPYQTSANPSGWHITTSRLPSGCGRQNPVSMVSGRTARPDSSVSKVCDR